MNRPAHGMGFSGCPTLQRLEPPMPSAYFSSASSDFKVLGAFFCNFAILAARPESRTVRHAPEYHIL